jgi:hypothetical protein
MSGGDPFDVASRPITIMFLYDCHQPIDGAVRMHNCGLHTLGEFP